MDFDEALLHARTATNLAAATKGPEDVATARDATLQLLAATWSELTILRHRAEAMAQPYRLC